MTENQKLREVLQHAIEDLSSATGFLTRRSRDRQSKTVAALAKLQADIISLPTDDHLPDAGEMVVDHFPDATKMIDSHTISAVVAECDMAILAKQPATGVPDDVVRDAERYRFIRDGSGWPAVFAAHNAPEPLRGDDLDSAIDAAMRKAKP